VATPSGFEAGSSIHYCLQYPLDPTLKQYWRLVASEGMGIIPSALTVRIQLVRPDEKNSS
jgi:hypothetical protein